MVLTTLAFVILPWSSSEICGGEYVKNWKDKGLTLKGGQGGTFQGIESPLVLADLVSDSRPRALDKIHQASANAGWKYAALSLGFRPEYQETDGLDGHGDVLICTRPFIQGALVDDDLDRVDDLLLESLYDDGVELPGLPFALNEAGPFRLAGHGTTSVSEATLVTENEPRMNVLGVLPRPSMDEVTIVLGE